jgi:hypothetical protein
VSGLGRSRLRGGGGGSAVVPTLFRNTLPMPMIDVGGVFSESVEVCVSREKHESIFNVIRKGGTVTVSESSASFQPMMEA